MPEYPSQVERLYAEFAAYRRRVFKIVSPVILILALALVVLGWFTHRLNAGNVAMAELARVEHEAKLKAEGEVVAARKSEAGMARALEAATNSNELFKVQVKDLQRTVHDLKAVILVQAHGEGTAHGNPIPQPTPAVNNDTTPSDAAPAPPLCLSCLLVEGSDVDAKLSQGIFSTKDKILLFRGTLKLSRKDKVEGGFKLEPILSMPITADDVKVDESFVALGQKTGWGYGPLAGIRKDGWVAGIVVLTPEVRLPLLGWPSGAIGQGATGPGGTEGTVAVYTRPGVK